MSRTANLSEARQLLIHLPSCYSGPAPNRPFAVVQAGGRVAESRSFAFFFFLCTVRIGYHLLHIPFLIPVFMSMSHCSSYKYVETISLR
jgi:hypothetical protein